MNNVGQSYGLDLRSWVFGTIEKVNQGVDWNQAWQQTYHEIGGKSQSSGRKGCPMKGTQTLYLLGRIKDAGVPYRELLLNDVWKDYSKNGAYSLLAIELLDLSPEISLSDLWTGIRKRIVNELSAVPSVSNQGGPTVAYKLWHLGLIVRQ